ncbi:MAG: PEP-CTERM sorting domain-containing protein [Akkermansiaceae bacterium]
MKTTVTLLAISALTATSNAATLYHAIGPVSNSSNSLTAGSPTNWVDIVGSTLSVDDGSGVTFDYTATLSGADIITLTQLRNGTVNFSQGDVFSVTIAISNVAGGTVNFDGFTYIDAGQTDNNSRREGFSIDGTDYVRNADYNLLGVSGAVVGTEIGANGVNISPAVFAGDGTGGIFTATAIAGIQAGGSANGVRLDGLEWSFTTAVPEPSSTALLGLGGLALILRRRK